jgi:hypothetical protein
MASSDDISITISDSAPVSINVSDETAINIDIEGNSPSPTHFIDLIDAPNSYTGQAGKLIQVNSTADGLEFTDSPSVVDWADITGDQSDISLSGFNNDLTSDNIVEGTTNLYDKTLVLNSGDGIEISGTYPNFTIKNTSKGNTDHSALDNLSYELSGHTGFQPAGSYLTTETDPVFVAHPAYGLTTQDMIDIGNLSGTNTGDETESTILTKIGYTPENVANKNQNNGYCGLDSGGKVPLTNLPSTLLKYQGVWNASTNTPTLVNPDLTKIGYVYNVSVEGTQFGIDFSLGDWLIYNSEGVPEKSDNSDDVTSVNSQTGTVVLDADDIDDTSTTHKFVTSTDITNLSNLSGTNTGDQSSSDFSLEDLGDVDKTNKATGKIIQVKSDGNHEYIDLPTPDLSGLLKLDQTTPQTITATDTTITASDEIYYGDATDGYKIKKDTIQGILDLIPAPDLSGLVPYTGATGNVDLGVNDLNVGGNITAGYFFGDGSHLTGIPSPDLSAYVPYTGATTDVDLGANNLTSNNFVTNYVTENINIKDSFEAITSGVNNIGIGTLVFPALTTGSNNIGIGKNLSPLMTSGSNNIFIGTQTGNRVTNPNDSVVIGIDALGWQFTNSQADRSVIIGKFAARGGTITRQVNDSVIIGEKAGLSGNKSVFIGAQAGQNYGSSRGYSVGIGYQSMGKSFSYTSNYGTAIGANSLYSITTGSGNVAIGYMAGSNITTTEYNTFIGTNAGRYLGTGTTSLTSATKGVFLGYNARGSANSQTNEIVIGYNAVGSGSNTATIGNTSQTDAYIRGNIRTLSDTHKHYFGAGNDASISYDGTNLVINPKAVGSGYLSVLGDIDAGANTIRTTGDVKGIHKTADGTAAVADGTYNFDGTAVGTVSSFTIKDGIITSITTR